MSGNAGGTYQPPPYELDSAPDDTRVREPEQGSNEAFEQRLLAQFEIEESSVGGTGFVKAWSAKDNCRVIIKRYAKADPDEKSRARREILALRAISDESVSKMVDNFDPVNTIFVVIEDRRDRTLKQLVEDNGSLPDNMLKSVMTQLFSGITAIFLAGWAHLRICDETLYLTEDGTLTIKEFEYAHEYDKEKTDQLYAITDARYGSDIYVAPEVFAGGEYNARKATLWSCGVAIVCYKDDPLNLGLFEGVTNILQYYMTTGQTERLSNLDHPVFRANQTDRRPSQPEGGGGGRRRSSLGFGRRKSSVTAPPNVVTYPGTRFEVPSYVRDIVSKLVTVQPSKRAELIEVAAKVPKEVMTKSARPLMELAWLDYKSHVGPYAGLNNVDERDSSSIYSGISNFSTPFASVFGGRRQSQVQPPAYGGYYG